MKSVHQYSFRKNSWLSLNIKFPFLAGEVALGWQPLDRGCRTHPQIEAGPSPLAQLLSPEQWRLQRQLPGQLPGSFWAGCLVRWRDGWLDAHLFDTENYYIRIPSTCLWLMDPHPDPDTGPAIFVTELQDSNQKLIYQKNLFADYF
jgi:hypothetical protein